MALLSKPFNLKLHLDLPCLDLQLQTTTRPKLVHPPLGLLIPKAFSSTAPTTTTTTLTIQETTQAEKRLSEFEKLHLLGHGNGGIVYKVRHKSTQAVYALKTIHGGNNSNNTNFARELEILRSTTNSPYVVQCHEIFEQPSGDIAIVMEYMDAGTLDNYVKVNGTFPESSIVQIARQVLNGLNYLQSKNIVHRDIKPANLLINQKKEVKIADFGVSKIQRHGLERSSSYVGTFAYMSPERLDPQTSGSDDSGYAGDVWSFGVTLMELYMGHYPYLPPGQKPDWGTIMYAVCIGDPPSLPTDASESFRDFIQCCLQKEASKRWSVEQLLSHPFVIDYKLF